MLTVAFAIFVGLFGTNDCSSTDEIPPLISFDKGRIGVNFFGFHATAGLGGLLTGNAADGGLYAGAGTPFGQSAHAGLGGNVDSQGRSVGGLFAGATAGGGVSAKAGLGGAAGAGNSYGTSYAGASAGPVSKVKVKSVGIVPDLVITNNPDNIQKVPVSKVKVKKVYAEKYIEPLQETAPIVPIESKKTFDGHVDFDVRLGAEIPPPPPLPPQQPVVIEKTKYKLRRRGPHLRKHVVVINGENNFIPPVNEIPPPVLVPEPAPIGGFAGQGSFVGTKSVTVQKVVNPQLITDIFNIPISTLTAVSNLVGGLAKGAEGSVTATKTFSVNAGTSIH